ncbi:hypothetical protein ACTXT7_005011 [Hymenolepis weldensis]
MGTLVLGLCARRALAVAISSAVNSGHYSRAFDERLAHHNILALDAEYAEMESWEAFVEKKKLTWSQNLIQKETKKEEELEIIGKRRM